MDSRFYRDHWSNSPRYTQNFRAVPIATAETKPLQSHKPKVVSIPIQFIQPENSSKPVHNTLSRSDYAIRIQKMWRGFRVRKNVKKIREIQRRLGEVEGIIQDAETVEALRRDEKERLKMSEMVMALLFKLDTIGGFDCAVKDLRKTFIRRAILLQERVDSITVTVAAVDQTMDDDSDAKLCEQHNPQLESPEKLNIENQDSDSDSDSESCGTSPSPTEESEQKPVDEKGEEESELVEREVVVVKEEKSPRNKEMLERMVEDNNKLMTLMSDLFEKSEMQTRILSSLSERVERLENAFACEKLWRRIKKQKNSRNSNSKSPDNNKTYF